MDNPFKNKKAIKKIALALFIIVMIALTAAGFYLAKLLSTEEGRDLLQGIVDKNVALGVVAYLLLQVLQVVVALIPGGVIQILGGILFGNFWGTVLCLIGLLLGTAAVFFMVRKFGMPVVEAFVDAKGINRFSFLNDTKKLEITVFILFLIPGMPKDALTYLVPLTKIKPSRFIILSMLARSPAVVLSILFGSSISRGDVFVAIPIFLAVAVLGLSGILLKDRVISALNRKKSEKDFEKG